jgi:uncharacterized membrane protein YfcA
MDPLIVLFGFGVGILVGLTGIGGGSLMTPLLIIVIGVKPVVAIGTDLAYGAITKTLGGWRHLRQGTVDLRLSYWMAAGSMPGAVAGTIAIERLHATHGKSFDDTILIILGGVLLGVSLAVLARNLFMPGHIAKEREDATLDRAGKTKAVTIGLVLGFILGFTSVGSGALIGLAYILVFHLTPKRVVGTDVFHAAILLWVAGLAHMVSGNVDFGLMFNILAGSLPGVWVGTHLISRVSSTALRPALSAVLLASSLAVLDKGGFDVPVAVIIGTPLVVGALVWVIISRRERAERARAVHQGQPVTSPLI